MDEKKVRNTIEAYLKAYEKNDRAGLLALFAADARFTDPVGTPTMLGREAIGKFWDAARKNGATLTPELQRIVVCANEAIALFRMKVRGADGSGLDLDVADHFVLNEDGTIREARAFWNPSCMTAVAAKPS